MLALRRYSRMRHFSFLNVFPVPLHLNHNNILIYNNFSRDRELLFHLFGALAQYERALTQERIKAGLAAARRRGRTGGRPRALDAEKREAVQAALAGGASKATVCRTFGIPRSTLYDALGRESVEQSPGRPSPIVPIRAGP